MPKSRLEKIQEFLENPGYITDALADVSDRLEEAAQKVDELRLHLEEEFERRGLSTDSPRESAPKKDPEPFGPAFDWNLDILSNAVENSRAVKFQYTKPGDLYGPPVTSTRVIQPLSVDAGPDAVRSSVFGIDRNQTIALGSEARRSFRFDRIEGYVRYADNAA